MKIKNEGRMTKIFEVELKARLEPGQKNLITEELGKRFHSIPEMCSYLDTYFDDRQKSLTQNEKELRLRKVIQGNDERILLTFKEPPFDEHSKSKNEHEIQISNGEVLVVILKQLGYDIDLHLQKDCINYFVEYRSYEVFITLASIAELGEDFMEVEVLTSEQGEINQIFDVLNEFLTMFNIQPQQLTNEYYTEAVKHARK